MKRFEHAVVTRREQERRVRHVVERDQPPCLEIRSLQRSLCCSIQVGYAIVTLVKAHHVSGPQAGTLGRNEGQRCMRRSGRLLSRPRKRYPRVRIEEEAERFARFFFFLQNANPHHLFELRSDATRDEPRVSEKGCYGAKALGPEALHDVEGVAEVFRVHRSSIPGFVGLTNIRPTSVSRPRPAISQHNAERPTEAQPPNG